MAAESGRGSGTPIPGRNDRRVDERDDDRSRAARDRDRILYSPEFRRLAQVTQVVGSRETQAFHNRLTHSLKVGQVGRRIAERLDREVSADLLEAASGIDADAVEAACLAHDLGHPPFGHLAEEELNHLLEEAGFEGFEGNAQSFRILTKLSFRRRSSPGLNLTRATLNATLKYPWPRTGAKERKWGAYQSESEDFSWARTNSKERQPSVEAQIMDWADDITYAVHDLEDFYRAGLIPLDRLRDVKSDVARTFVKDARDYVVRKLAKDGDRFEAAFGRICSTFPASPFTGSRLDVIGTHGWASGQIRTYIASASCSNGGIQIDEDARDQVTVLKQLTWHFVINSPSLATLQRGQRETIRTLFTNLNDWARDAWGDEREVSKLPRGLREYLLISEADPGPKGGKPEREALVARAVVDYIASLTEEQCVILFQRLTGGHTLPALDLWLHH